MRHESEVNHRERQQEERRNKHPMKSPRQGVGETRVGLGQAQLNELQKQDDRGTFVANPRAHSECQSGCTMDCHLARCHSHGRHSQEARLQIAIAERTGHHGDPMQKQAGNEKPPVEHHQRRGRHSIGLSALGKCSQGRSHPDGK
jgi:hypothetical protein